MPASDSEFHDAFERMVGTDGEQEIYSGHMAEGWTEWATMFSETGIDYDSSADTVDAFEQFLVAFYPDTATSPEEWRELREEFYEQFDIDEHDIDWEAYREAIGY